MIKYNNYTYTVTQYEDKDQLAWDNFIDKSRNGTFLHKINYFHYHRDRYNDCSLMIKNNDEVLALMPGNIENEIFYTHQGLTFGGLITLKQTKVEEVLDYFNVINKFLYYEKNISKVIYKAIPYIYTNIPAQEDQYALFRLGARIVGSGISSVIHMREKQPYSSQRIKGIKKTKKYNFEIRIDYSYIDFWTILTNNLMTYHNTLPVHSILEINKLKEEFVNNIKLYSVYFKGECIAGVVMYITDNVAHAQYTAASEYGKKTSALDYLYDYLINKVFYNTNYFSLGTSVENNGYFLNEGLINQKQGPRKVMEC